MNELAIKNSGETMTSMQIASITGKKHKHIMEAIRKMQPVWEKVGGSKFRLTSYSDSQGKERPCYALTKIECLFVSTKFKDEARAKLVLRWEQLEREKQAQMQPQVPTSFREALLLAAEQQAVIEEQQKLLSVKEEQVSLLTNKVAEMSEKVSYLDQILNCKSTMLVTQIAQDYGVGAVTFNKWLESLHIQHKVGEQWILYYDYLDKGYVHSDAIEIQTPYGLRVKNLTKWAQKGRVFLYHKLKENGYLPLIEKVA